MRKILKTIKILLARGLFHSGLWAVFARRRLGDQAVVLTYHRVIDEQRRPRPDSNPGIIVSADTFDMQMRALRDHLNPVSLADFHAHVEHGKPLPPKSCLVTFDDGWLDNYEVAFPILQKYKIPAVVFIPLDYIDNNIMFWQEEMLMWLTTLLSAGDADSLQRLASLLNKRESDASITIHDIRAHVVAMKDSSDDVITEALQSLRQELGKNGEPAHYNRYLNWQQVKEMRTAGIDFASHALSHRILCRMSDERCREELQQSRTLLEQQLGEPVRAIAYPNGDHDERVMRKTREAGYTLAFATTSGLYSQADEPLSIPRMNVHENNSRDKALFLCATINLL